MTAKEAIDTLAKIKPHSYDGSVLLKWISDLEKLIWNEVLRWHDESPNEPEPYEMVEGEGDEPDTVPDVTLLVPEPYSDIYVKYLSAMVEYHNDEIGRYNNCMILFNAALEAFASWYNRLHMPKQDYYIRI